jgi:polyisoprenoid-binding protein YceI
MKRLSLLFTLLFLPLALSAADRVLKIDKTRSYVDVAVDATVNFTARLEKYETDFSVDAAGKIKTARLSFKFADLKTGEAKRDEAMIEWLGGGEPAGRFEVLLVALAPDGQGQVAGKLTMNGQSQRVEFPVNISKDEGVYKITGECGLDHRQWGLKVIRKAYLFKVNPLLNVRFQFTGVLPAEPKED